MIKVDISTALFLYLLFSAVLMLLAWSFVDFGTRLKNFSSEERHIWYCGICGNTYIDSVSEHISCCPRCSSYNERLLEKDLSVDARRIKSAFSAEQEKEGGDK